jgi:hypothetical protein
MKYSLGGQSVETVVPMPDGQQTLENASIKIGRTSEGVKTVMKFTKFLVEPNEIEIVLGMNNFLWAHGSDETLAYHAGRSAIYVNLMSGETMTPSTAIVTDPTEGAISLDEVSITEPSTILATEATVASSAIGTEGTIAIDAIDLDVTATEPTTQEVDTNSTTESNMPTYYPTTHSELITEVLTPEADTFVEFNSSKAFGMRSWTKVDGQPERITLIRFDMSSLVRNKAVELLSAKLRLYALTESPFGGKIDIVDEDICGEWNENSLSWANAPPGVFSTPPESLGSFGPSQEFVWNEADLTLDLFNLPLKFTIKITSDKANGVTYASKENVTAVPELVLEYMGWMHEETDVPTMTPTEGALVQAAIALPTLSPITAAPTMPPAEPITIEVLRDGEFDCCFAKAFSD